MELLALLPLLAFLFFLIRLVRISPEGQAQPGDLAFAFVASSILWGICVALSTEVLSLLHAISPVPFAGFWFAVIMPVFYRGKIKQRSRVLLNGVLGALRSLDRIDRIMFAFIASVILLVFSIAIIAPPNNVDSLLYHMSRVVHWVQNRAVSHYPTAYEHQLFMPIWAETAILHFRVLFGSDRLANLIQWFSFLGSAIVLAAIASQLGMSRRMQIVTALAVVTLPMAILQSSSTQNDLVITFWLSCLVFLLLRSSHYGVTRHTLALIGAVVGLGMLTKATFYVYAVPAGLFFGWMVSKRFTKKQFAERLVFPLVIVLLINSGYWLRNYRTYGSIIGPNDFVRSSLLGDAEVSDQGGTAMEGAELGLDFEKGSGIWKMFTSRLGRVKTMVLWNMAVALSPLRDRVPYVDNVLVVLLDHAQYAMLDSVLWNHEDTAGNPVHVLLIGIASLSILFISRRDANIQRLRVYVGLLLLSYIMLPLVITNAASIDGIRFQLPFFVLAAPLIADALSWRRGHGLMLILLAISSIPWLLFNNIRPLIGWSPWVTRIPSVLFAPAEDMLFAMRQGSLDEYQAVIQEINDRQCEQIGLVLDSHDYEYLIWDLLDAPESGIRLESIEYSQRLVAYADPNFQPCAVICTICDGRTGYAGKVLSQDYGTIALYVPQ